MIPFKEGCYITSPMGNRTNPVDGKKEYHSGIDMVPLSGDDGVVISPFYGTVCQVGKHADRGTYVAITTTSKQVIICQHFDTVYTSEGATLQQGTALGMYGSTGKVSAKHLHIEAWKTFDDFKSANKANLLPIYELLDIPNAKGTYKQNVDYDLVVSNPLYFETTPEEAWAWATYKDDLAKPLAKEYGTSTAFDSSKFGDLAIVVNGRYIQGEAQNIELKNSTADSSASLKMNFDSKMFSLGGIAEGDYIQAYTKSSKKYLFFGRITKLEKSTSKYTLEAKNRLWYLSQSDMTVQFNDGQNTASAIRALCNKMHLSHRICKMDTTLTSSMIYYKDKFANILKKLIEHEETYSGKKYLFAYDYEQAMLVIEEKGNGKCSIDVDTITELSVEHDVSGIKNVVYAYDAQAKVASAPIVDESSVEKNGAIVYYFPISDTTTSAHIQSYLDLNKDPLTSGEVTCFGRFDLKCGAEISLKGTDPLTFPENGKLVIESITQKLDSDHLTKIEFSAYKSVDVPTQEETEAYVEETITRETDEALRLGWLYYTNFDDVVLWIYSENKSEINSFLKRYYTTTYKMSYTPSNTGEMTATTVEWMIWDEIPKNNAFYSKIANKYYSKMLVQDEAIGYIKLTDSEVNTAVREAIIEGKKNISLSHEKAGGISS